MAQGSPDTGRSRPSLWTVVVILLGVSGGAAVVSSRSGREGPGGPSTAGLPLTNEPSVPPDAQLLPLSVPRALGLVADFLGEPLFSERDKPNLTLAPFWQRLLDNELRGRAKEPAERVLVRLLREEARKRNVEVQFLVATLPDYADSSGAWKADPSLAAIQRAAATAGLQFDRFYLPDARPAEPASAVKAGASRDDLHEREPGGLLFRRALVAEASDQGSTTVNVHIWLVLTVPEIATSGLHLRAFAQAVKLPLLWDRGEPIRILGPNFSGSTLSLRLGLERMRDEWMKDTHAAGIDVRVVTGGATSTVNPKLLRIPGLEVTFEALVRSDPEALVALADYLGRIDSGWRCGNRMALLIEANTTWGDGLSAGDAPEDDCRFANVLRGAEKPFPRALRIPFPLHISRLRADSGSRTGGASTAATAARLQLGEGPSPTDRVPAFTPGLTSAVVETTLAGIFRTIRKGDFTAVGIFGSDQRDHLFLAQEVARQATNLQIFTLESDLLYLHANAGAFLRGTLVASTYSLFDRTQLLTAAPGSDSLSTARVPFESTAAQGTFNGFLKLLGREDLLVDYGRPGVAVGAPAPAPPPVWISVVGRGALMPLEPVYPEIEPGASYAWVPLPATSPREQEGTSQPAPRRFPYLPPSPLLGALGFALGAFVGLHLAFVAGWMHLSWRGRRDGSTNRSRVKGRLRRWIGKLRDRCRVPGGVTGPMAVWHARIAAEQRASLYACGAAVVVAGTWLLQLGWVWYADRRGAAVAIPWAVAAVRDLVLLCVVLAIPLGFPVLLERWRRGSSFVPFRVVPLSAGLVAVWYFREYLEGPQWRGVPALLNFERSLAPGSFVSPGPVILLLCCGLYLWGAWNIQRLGLVSPPEAESGVFDFLRGRLRGLDLDDCLHQPLMRMGAWTGGLPLLALAVLFTASFRYIHTVEGRSFSLFMFWGTACLVTAFVHTLAHSVHVGRVLLVVLGSLDRHPIAPAFARVGKQPFPWGLSFQSVRPADLEPLAGCAARLGESVAAMKPRSLDAVLASTYGLPPAEGPRREHDAAQAQAPPDIDQQSIADRARALDLGVRIQDIKAIETLRDMPRMAATDPAERIEDTQVWRALARLSVGTSKWLSRVYWNTSLTEKGDEDPRARFCREAETLLAFQVAVVVRDMLRRLVSGLSLAMGGLLLLTLLHLLFAFQGRRFWITFDWVCLGVTSLLAVVLLVGLEKNGVLSRLWATDPGRINFTGGLIYRIVGYAAVPVVMLLGTVFPEIMGNVTSWIDRVRPTLP